jgi:hypothetical protein
MSPSTWGASSGCTDADGIDAFLRGEASTSSREALERHLASCRACRQLLSVLVRLDTANAQPLDSTPPAAQPGDLVRTVELERGSRIGRYVVLERLGEGAMGVVYAARDPELDRKVALKLLRGDFDPAEGGLSRDRIRREAQAMARMAHPNVVTVYDVGTWGDRIFIAMEIVEGETLSQWLARSRRSWREVIVMFLPAGHGLAAAHAAGLVHRDFKPANVLIGGDGRVRVGDFGLAALTPAPADGATACAGELAAAIESRSTRGPVGGTPYYMAPEQFGGGRADARSDQFSFCVALYAAIAGIHPFQEHTALARLERGGGSQRWRRWGAMPRWLRAVLLRGLALDPADRYPSMTALLESLAGGPRRRLRLVVLGSAAALALVVIGTTRRALEPPSVTAAARHDKTVFAGSPDMLRAYDREWVALNSGGCESPGARCAIQATNVLRNAGFDRPGRAWLATGPSQVQWVGGSLRLTASRRGGGVAQEVPWIIHPGKCHAFTAWLRVPPGHPPVRGTARLWAIGPGGSASSSTRFVADSEWSAVSVTSTAKAHYNRFHVELSLDSPGSIDIDNADLADTGLSDSSFEIYRSPDWLNFNFHTDVELRSVMTDAFDGQHAYQVRTARPEGSMAQDTPQIPLVGTTYTFVAWLRAGPGEDPVGGNLVLWALRGRERRAQTAFKVGRSWTRVEVSLDVAEYGHSALRAEIYLHTVDAWLEVDATRVVPAGLMDASFETDSAAWRALPHEGRPRDLTIERLVESLPRRSSDGLFEPGSHLPMAKNGGRWLRLASARGGGSIAQDIEGRPLAGATYSFSAWVRAAADATVPVHGSLSVHALGGAREQGRTDFVASKQWRLVSATLEIQDGAHSGLRVAISADPGARLDVDGTRLTGASLLTADAPERR